MSYDPILDKNTAHAITTNSHPGVKIQITPSANDIVHAVFGYPKAIAVHVTGGGRAQIAYLPTRNTDAQSVSVEVADGWVSDTSVRRVMTLSAVGEGTATVWGLYA